MALARTLLIFAFWLFVAGCYQPLQTDRRTSDVLKITNSAGQAQSFSTQELLQELRSREIKSHEISFSLDTISANKDFPKFSGLSTPELLNSYMLHIQSIYGYDKRQDILSVSNNTIVKLADSIVSGYASANILDRTDGFSDLVVTNFGLLKHLCPGERFADQPTGAFCSGTLIGPDRLLTVNHCVNGDLRRIRFVFGFRIASDGNPVTRISKTEIYSPIKIIKKSDSELYDWAIVQLDRIVSGHEPALCAKGNAAGMPTSRGDVYIGQQVFTLGYPSGLPIKYAPGEATDVSAPHTFLANVDTFQGNSGAPIFASFNGNFRVVGVLTQGKSDFITVHDDKNGDCARALRYSPGLGGEICIRASEFAEQVP